MKPLSERKKTSVSRATGAMASRMVPMAAFRGGLTSVPASVHTYFDHPGWGSHDSLLRYLPNRPVRYPATWSAAAKVGRMGFWPSRRNVFESTPESWEYSPVRIELREGQHW